MKIGTIIALSVGLTFAFVINASVLGITSGLVGELTNATASGGALETYAAQISDMLGGLMSGAGYAGKLAPLAVIVGIFGVDRMLRQATE
ncbi:TPA: hypothetical protein EYP13_04335 [Candidatus Micrarchaeota archaeon]|nr:hypothetical protein [Candidatus Micrarchaeota archaeon]